MGNGHALGGASDHGDSGLLFKDPHTRAPGSQGAAGAGLGSPLGGDLLFELLVFPGILGSPLAMTGLLLGPVKPLRDGPLEGRDALMASGGAKPLHRRVAEGTAKAPGSGGIEREMGRRQPCRKAGH